MRHKLFAILVGMALVLGTASSVLATDFGVALTITGGTVVGRTGEVTITGSVSCTEDVVVTVDVALSQVVGRFNTLRSAGSASFECFAADGQASFSIPLLADEGKFASGPARLSANANAYVCGPEVPECSGTSDSYGPASIRLGGPGN
jgi:hypothetical protein